MKVWAALLAACALGALALRFALAPERFAVRAVHIQAPLRYLERAELERMLAVHATGNLLRLDARALERHLRAHPWVAEARVRRVWPAALRVRIVEQAPVARWGGGGFLNARGERLPEGPAPDLPAVILQAADGREAAMVDLLARLRAALRPHALEVRALRESGRRALTLTLADGLVLRLGREAPLARLVRWLRYRTAFLRAVPAATEIDLRYPNGFAVRVRPAQPDRSNA